VRLTVSSGPENAAVPGTSGRTKVAKLLVMIAVLVLVALFILILKP
jgi:hypothetical protein